MGENAVMAVMKRVLLLLATLLVAVAARAVDKPAELVATTFRFVRTEVRTFPASNAGEKAVSVRYGLFAFSHTQPAGTKFFGFGRPAADGRFDVRFAAYEVRDGGRWNRLQIGYCGTGTETFELSPSVEYLFRIPINMNGIRPGDEIRVSAPTTTGEFWSDGFKVPAK